MGTRFIDREGLATKKYCKHFLGALGLINREWLINANCCKSTLFIVVF